MVLDGYEGAVSPFNLTYSCSPISAPVDCNTAIQTTYSGTGANLKFNFVFSAGTGYQFKQWRYNTTILSTLSNVNLVFQGAGTYNICADYINTATGQLATCCKTSCISLPTACEDVIQQQYVNGVYKLSIAGNNANYQNVSWRNDTDGINIDPTNMPASCRNLLITVRYYNTVTSCWVLCCKNINFCAPTSCQENIQYTYNGSNNSFNFTFNNPSATHIIWKFDEDGSVLPNGVFSLPQGWTCQEKTVSVYYYDTIEKCWKVCCRKITICPPVSCENAIQYTYNPTGNKFEFTLNIPGASHQIWKFDDDGTVLPNGAFSMPQNWVCKEKIVSVYYFNPATQCWSVCCKKVTLCPPVNCETVIKYAYIPNGNKFQFTLDIPNAQHVIWKFDEDGTILPNGVFSLPTGWVCKDRTVSAYYYDPATQSWKVCCRKVTICPPANCDSAISYTYDEANNKFVFSLNNPSAQHLIWKFEEDNLVLTNGAFTLPSGWVCAEKTVSVYYFNPATQCWIVCCKKINICPPANCQDRIVYTYSSDGNTLNLSFLNSSGITNVQWTQSGTNIGTTSTITVPVTSTCGPHTFSISYLENGAWKMCCKNIYLCNPSHCTSAITQTHNATAVTLNVNPAFTNVVWTNAGTGAILGTGNQIQLPFVNGAVNVPVVVSYYDPSTKYFNSCSKSVSVVSCTNPIANFTHNITGVGVNFTSTSTGAVTYTWNFGSGTPAAGTTINSQNPVVVFLSGTHNVCLTVTNSCGSSTQCHTVTINSNHDCTFSIPNNICGSAGQDVLIPIQVAKFNDILTFNFTVRCSDPSKLSFIGLEQYNSTIENGSNHYIQPDHVRFFWSQANAKSLPDQTALFYIRCRFSSTATTPVNIFFSDDPVKSEAYSGSLQKLSLQLVNGSACINALPTGHNISGVIKTHSSLKLMPATEVKLMTNPQNMNVTNNEGKYSFNQVAAGTQVEIKPEKNTDHLNGVNALDIVRLQRHLLLIDPLNTPYKQIAADVNNDKVINALDVVILQRMQLRLIETFPSNTSWRFVPVAHQFQSNFNVSQNFPESITYNPLNSDQMQSDFYAIKVGDLDDSNTQSIRNLGGNNRNAVDSVRIQLGSSYALNDGTFLVPVRAKDFNRMVAIEGSVKWDSTKVKLISVQDFGIPGLREDNFATLVNQGQKVLTFNWTDGSINGVSLNNDKVIFTLKFKALGAAGENTKVEWSNLPLPLFAANADLATVVVKPTNAVVQFIAPISAQLEAKDVTCTNLNDGVIKINTFGGTGNYIFQWSNGIQTNSNIATNLSAGSYTCVVKDTLSGLEITISSEINSPEALSFTSSVSDGVNSSYNINLTVQGGVKPYSYIWSNGNTSDNVTVSNPGTYDVIIIDSNGCSIKSQIEVQNTISSSKDLQSNIFKIAPNPSSDFVVLRNVDAAYVGQQFNIVNITGQIVYKGTIENELRIDVSSLDSGLYLMNTVLEGKLQSIKFTVIR